MLLSKPSLLTISPRYLKDSCVDFASSSSMNPSYRLENFWTDSYLVLSLDPSNSNETRQAVIAVAT